MSSNKVVWSEGMFLRPQHFQQEQHYFEVLVERKTGSLQLFGWGFSELKLDEALLARGKVGLLKAVGIFPDGTPFDIPRDTPAPPSIKIDESCKDTAVVLAFPQYRAGIAEIATGGDSGGRRFQARDVAVRDVASASDVDEVVQVAEQTLRICLANEITDDWSKLAFTLVVESRSDGVKLSNTFVPPVLNVAIETTLRGYLMEVANLVRHRARMLAERIAQPGSSGVSEFADFLLLQLCNRMTPLLRHLEACRSLHPEALYRVFIELAGELGTFGNKDRLAVEFGRYRHDDLANTMRPVIEEIRKVLTGVLEQTAISIPWQERGRGVYVGAVQDLNLLQSANFVLAATANMPSEQLRGLFRTQVKLGSVEKIRDLVMSALPGVMLSALPAVPRQIPYHAGFVYFELDRSSDLWKSIEISRVIAMHIAGEFPGLQLELWAIRDR